MEKKQLIGVLQNGTLHSFQIAFCNVAHCAVLIPIHYPYKIPLFFFLLGHSPAVGQGLLIHEVSISHTTTHHSRQDSSGRVIRSSQRPLPDNTQHSQQRDFHDPGGIRTHSPSRRAAAEPRLRPRGHRAVFVYVKLTAAA